MGQQGLDDGSLQNAEAHSPGMQEPAMEACICLQAQLDELNKRMMELETGLMDAGVIDRLTHNGDSSHDGGFCAHRHVGPSVEEAEREELRRVRHVFKLPLVPHPRAPSADEK